MYSLDVYNPESEFIKAEVSNPQASDAMSLAADYRAEGMSPSEALQLAWQDVKGEDDDDDEMEFEPSPLLVLLAAGGIGLLLWRKFRGYWPWQQAEVAKQRQQAISQAQAIARAAAKKRQGNPGIGAPVVVHDPHTGEDFVLCVT